MKKLIGSVAILTAALGLSACVQSTPAVNMTNISDVDFSKVENFKEGRDCSYYLFGIAGPLGDAHLSDAVRHAGVKKVHIIDYSSEYYVLFSRKCIRVEGE